MIFKTFDNKIDKWTAKIGVFGKSFNELGTAVNNTFKSVIGNANNFDENVGFWESLKNNLFAKKDWKKNSLGEIISQENIDSYIKEMDLDSAKKNLKDIFDWNNLVKNGDATWSEYFETLNDGTGKYIPDLIKNTNDLSKLTGEDLVKANQQARASALAHNEAIKSQTFSAKAGKVAFQALAMAGNMLAMWGISKALGLFVQGIDGHIHKVERARERTSELLDEFKEMQDTLADHKEVVADLADRYGELSKGVNPSTNENVSLSTEEYEEFLSMNEQLADTFPSLSKGIADNGSAILSLGTKSITAKEQLGELLRTEEDLNNFRVAEGLDEAFKGVYTYVEEADNAAKKMQETISGANKEIGVLNDFIENGVTLKQGNYPLFSGDITDQAKTDYVYAMQAAAQEFFNGLDESRRMDLFGKGLRASSLFTMNTNDLTGTFDLYASLYSLEPTEITTLEELISDNVGALKGAIRDQIGAQETELQAIVQQGEGAWRDFIPNVVAGMKSQQTFKDLNDPALQSMAIKMVEGLDLKAALDMKNSGLSMSGWLRENITTPLSDLDDEGKDAVKDSFESLVKLDASNLSQSNQAEIERVIQDIAALLGKDPLELRVIFGFDVGDAQNRYDEALKATKHKFGGHGYDDRGFETNINNDVGDEIDDFWNKNVVTEEDVATWEEAASGLSDLDAAMDAFLKKKKQAAGAGAANPSTASDIFSLRDAENALTPLGELNEQLNNIQAAYKNLKDAMDAYSSAGSITMDQFQAIVEQGAEFLDYLTLEDGQLSMNEQSMYDLAKARLTEMKAQMVQGIIDNVSDIHEEADANRYLASTNYELEKSYHKLAESQLAAWAESALANGWSQDKVDEVTNKARADIRARCKR